MNEEDFFSHIKFYSTNHSEPSAKDSTLLSIACLKHARFPLVSLYSTLPGAHCRSYRMRPTTYCLSKWHVLSSTVLKMTPSSLFLREHKRFTNHNLRGVRLCAVSIIIRWMELIRLCVHMHVSKLYCCTNSSKHRPKGGALPFLWPLRL